MPPTAASTPGSLPLGAVVRECLSRPVETLVRQWNYKAAITSATVRALLFLAVNASAGAAAAFGAALTEFSYRAVTAGFYGAITQHLGRVDPPRVGWISAMVCLPLIGHGGEFLMHWSRGTPNLGSSVLASMCLTALSTSFNLFAMRHGVLVVGVPGRQSLAADLRALPGVALAFVRMLVATTTRGVTSTADAIGRRGSRYTPVVAIVLAWSSPATPQDAPGDPAAIVARLESLDAPPVVSYRAVRRIDASNPRFGAAAWAEVVTALSADRGFTWHTVREGGSGVVRRRAIRALLEGEAAAVSRGDPARARIGVENYAFGDVRWSGEGGLEVAISSRGGATPC